MRSRRLMYGPKSTPRVSERISTPSPKVRRRGRSARIRAVVAALPARHRVGEIAHRLLRALLRAEVGAGRLGRGRLGRLRRIRDGSVLRLARLLRLRLSARLLDAGPAAAAVARAARVSAPEPAPEFRERPARGRRRLVIRVRGLRDVASVRRWPWASAEPSGSRSSAVSMNGSSFLLSSVTCFLRVSDAAFVEQHARAVEGEPSKREADDDRDVNGFAKPRTWRSRRRSSRAGGSARALPSSPKAAGRHLDWRLPCRFTGGRSGGGGRGRVGWGLEYGHEAKRLGPMRLTLRAALKF